MSPLFQVAVSPLSLDRFGPILGAGPVESAKAVGVLLRERLEGRTLWTVNSTAVGGGVAEMLQSLLRYARGIGIDARWIVIDGDPEFYRITKRIHHALHGSPGDGSPLDARAHEIYRATQHRNAQELAARVRPGDVMLLHDPQTAGLAKLLSGVHTIWRSHIGCDQSNDQTEMGWSFLEPYLEAVSAYVFSRAAYVPEFCDPSKTTIIQPSIDAFACKNRDLDTETIRTVLVHTGFVEGPPPDPPKHEFEREDGTVGRVARRADIVRMGRPPSWDTPLVVQVSRWDRLKDPIGVMQGFASICNGRAPSDAHLVLAGPNVSGVTDDPEGGVVLDETIQAWRRLPHSVRDRVHLACIPTGDVEENAIIVNALQRHAAVVVQKSLREGFGLTVTEAMWKARPVVATAVGGIQDQIEDGTSGVLLADPRDTGEFGAALKTLLGREAYAEQLGKSARERVRQKFLGVRHLLAYAQLMESMGV